MTIIINNNNNDDDDDDGGGGGGGGNSASPFSPASAYSSRVSGGCCRIDTCARER